jgi:hypothetical protein
MSIWETVETALAGIAIPQAANFYQAASGSSLPDEFLVYFLLSSIPEQHGDDAETLRSWRVEVNYYNRAGLANLPGIDAAMVAASFTRGPQRELPYNQLTRHHSLALEYILLTTQEAAEASA